MSNKLGGTPLEIPLYEEGAGSNQDGVHGRCVPTARSAKIAAMHIEIARIALRLLQQRRDAFLHDVSLPLSVRGMINVHLEKPWIPDFWSVAIRSFKPGSERYFDFPIGYAEDGTSWFFPSRQWWIAHAQASHPPAGIGCDIDVHTKFLSSEGSAHEFDYATVATGGQLTILGRADFARECAFWTQAFGSPQEEPSGSP